MGREENVTVFEDTERLCKTDERLVQSVRASVEGQKVILETDVLPKPELGLFSQDARVIVSQKRTFEAAAAYKEGKVCVHNFASASNPGGGVTRGASAQEECLCRCSGLYFCLNTPENWQMFYEPHRNQHDPLHNDDIIFTPNVTVFKTDTVTPKQMKERDWYTVDVITCAAPNLRALPSNKYNSGDGKKAVVIEDARLQEIHEKRLQRILDVAVCEGADTVILGAFGCGAFQNKPEVVAAAAKNVISKYLRAFQTIEFAVYCSPREDANYRVFQKVLG